MEITNFLHSFFIILHSVLVILHNSIWFTKTLFY